MIDPNGGDLKIDIKVPVTTVENVGSNGINGKHYNYIAFMSDHNTVKSLMDLNALGRGEIYTNPTLVPTTFSGLDTYVAFASTALYG